MSVKQELKVMYLCSEKGRTRRSVDHSCAVTAG